MVKKIFLLFALALPSVMGAQRITDTWKIHPLFAGAKAQNTIDAGDRVYYLASNNLFCYYKDTQENEALNKSNYLSDVAVTGAYYDEARKMVIVTYDNGNMDVVNGDGKVTIADVNRLIEILLKGEPSK
mgnify:CR=1 FL=1